MDEGKQSRTGLAVGLIALIPLVLHLWPNAAYTYFGDELYYLACTRHMAAGFVDHPPLSIWFLKAWTAVFGDSVFALRIPPALASAGLVLLASRITARLGGGGVAQALTALVAALAPIYLAVFDFYSMNAFEVLLWSGIVWCVIVRIQNGEPRTWLWIGVLVGIGMLNKHTVSLLAAGLVLGVVLTPLRTDLRTRWPWIAAVIAAVLFLPNLVWQLQNDWPSLEFYRNAHVGKNIDMAMSEVLLGQGLAVGPAGALLVLFGLGSLLLRPARKELRVFLWMYIVLLASMISSGSSRPDRIAGAYPILIAAGAVWIESVAGLARVALRRVFAVVLVVLLTIPMVPIAVAATPKPLALKYAHAMGDLLKIESGEQTELPLWLAFRQGWEGMAQGFADAAATLTPEERERAIIYTSSYGWAGALDRYGPELDLPPVICPHNSYYGWGVGKGSSDVYLVSNLADSSLDILFNDWEVAVEVDSPNGYTFPIHVARDPIATFEQVWDQLRHYQ